MLVFRKIVDFMNFGNLFVIVFFQNDLVMFDYLNLFYHSFFKPSHFYLRKRVLFMNINHLH